MIGHDDIYFFSELTINCTVIVHQELEDSYDIQSLLWTENLIVEKFLEGIPTMSPSKESVINKTQQSFRFIDNSEAAALKVSMKI